MQGAAVNVGCIQVIANVADDLDRHPVRPAGPGSLTGGAFNNAGGNHLGGVTGAAAPLTTATAPAGTADVVPPDAPTTANPADGTAAVTTSANPAGGGVAPLDTNNVATPADGSGATPEGMLLHDPEGWPDALPQSLRLPAGTCTATHKLACTPQ